MSEDSGVAEKSIQRIEQGRVHCHETTKAALIAAFARRHVDFIELGNGEYGVTVTIAEPVNDQPERDLFGTVENQII